MIYNLALLGGLYAVLTYIHTLTDFVFQSHAEAMVKHNHPKIRAKHCLVYTFGFVPLLCFCHFSFIEWVIALNILFWSHFYIDTYQLVYLWAKTIRRPPEMSIGIYRDYNDPKAGFVQFIKTPLGKILMIVVDQLCHLAFLFPIAYMILRHK